MNDQITTWMDEQSEYLSNLNNILSNNPLAKELYYGFYCFDGKVIQPVTQDGFVQPVEDALDRLLREEEVLEALDDLRNVKCDVVTIGQYLQPTPKNLPVSEFVHPDKFERYRKAAVEKGFLYVESGPLVRSSYHAEKHVL